MSDGPRPIRQLDLPRPRDVAASCPIRAAEDALSLLRSGRAWMAERVLERLPELMRAAFVRGESLAYLQGRAAQAQVPAGPNAPPKPSRLAWLRAEVGDPARRERAKAALRFDDAALTHVLEGRATLSGGQWRKLRQALRWP